MVDRYVRIPHPFKPDTFVQGRVLEIKHSKEYWNEYELEDGTIVKVKLCVNHISIPLDPVTKKPLKKPNGEPIFNVNWTIHIVPLYPREKITEMEEKEHGK